MASVIQNGSTLGNALQSLLTENDGIQPGVQLSYELAKTIFTFHPLGAKLSDRPIEMAQSQAREIEVPNSPEERVKEAFEKEWLAINADINIFNTARLSRVYGIASIACLVEGQDTNKSLEFDKLYKEKITFNVYDPLNTAGSLVLNQNPLAMDFQHTTDIRVGGQVIHRSRSCVLMHESPIYIEYTTAAFGFVGRSVYQRSLFPLKSFLQSMITDDMITVKAGVIVAKMKSPGSIVDQAMAVLFGQKRQVVKEAQVGNTISIGTEEDIISLDLTNLEGPMTMARKNILENIASSAGMPAKLVTQETLAEGFGEGTEDAKEIARYIDRVREQLKPLYDYFDKIVMHRAWNPDFYKTIQNDFDEYKGKSYNEAFYEWKNSFVAKWPSLLKEPDSEMVKVEEVKLRAALAYLQVLAPDADPKTKVELTKWVVDNLNSMKFLFSTPLTLDFETMMAFYEDQEEAKKKAAENALNAGSEEGEGGDKKHGLAKEPSTPKPFAAMDAVADFEKAVRRLQESRDQRKQRGVPNDRR